MKIITSDSQEYVAAYQILAMGGGWPHGFGWLRESPQCVDAMRVIEGEVQDMREENVRKLKQRRP